MDDGWRGSSRFTEDVMKDDVSVRHSCDNEYEESLKRIRMKVWDAGTNDA